MATKFWHIWRLSNFTPALFHKKTCLNMPHKQECQCNVVDVKNLLFCFFWRFSNSHRSLLRIFMTDRSLVSVVVQYDKEFHFTIYSHLYGWERPKTWWKWQKENLASGISQDSLSLSLRASVRMNRNKKVSHDSHKNLLFYPVLVT